MNYQAIIFDLDGTLLDTLEDLCDSVNFALQTKGYPLRSLAEVRSFVGNGIRNLIERSLPDGCDSVTIDDTLLVFKDYYKDHCAIKTKPYPGILSLLQGLQSTGQKIGIFSNKADFAVVSLCKDYFPNLYHVARGELPQVPKKPSPEGLLAILDAWGIKKESAVYVGDSEVDIETARNAQVDAILVDWGFRDPEELRARGATCIVSSIKELQDRL